MIIALLALAFAMIFGGILTAFFGWDIVLIERGWVMVLAGSFSAACGALLVGITAAVSKLARIQSELAGLQIEFDRAVREEGAATSTDLSTAALAGGLLGGTLHGREGAKNEGDQDDEKQADLPLFADSDKLEPVSRDEPEAPKAGEPFPPFPPRTSPEAAERRDEEDMEVKVPDFLLAERLRETHAESPTSEDDHSLFDDKPKLDASEGERRDDQDREDVLEPVSEPVLDVEPEPEPEPLLAEKEPAAPTEPAAGEQTAETSPSGPTIIGTYNSGDNTYVMFSDGSIEAQTPSGIFRFQSLDELKAFIASGGEGGPTST